MIGWKSDGKVVLREAFERFHRSNPHTFARFQSVIESFLLDGGSGQEEVSIVTARHALWSNPVSVISQAIGCQDQLFLLRHRAQRAFAIIELLTIQGETRSGFFVYSQHFLIVISQEDIGLFKEFANSSGSEALTEGRTSFRVGN